MFHRPTTTTKPETSEIVKEAVKQSGDDSGVTIKQVAPARHVPGQAAETVKDTTAQSQNKTEENKMSNEEQEKTTTRTIDIPSQSPTHARTFPPSPAAMAPRIPGSYAPATSYPGAHTPSYGAPQQDTKAVVAGAGRRLIIGQGITLSGEIEACEYLVIEGTVEAALKGASMLEIAETGTFYGTVEIDEATVAGRFEGDITVNGRLTITSTGSVTGSIAYRELAVEAGATLDGKISPLATAQPAAKKSDKHKDANGAARGARSGSHTRNSGDDSELPFSGSSSQQISAMAE